jgi:tagatose-1,6-bisphosphate aldolase
MKLESPLDNLTNEKRRFGVFAIDHRDSLRAFVRPDAPDSLTAAESTALKDQMVRAIGPEATGVMLEPEYSIPQLIESGAVPRGVGFTAALEAQGYLGDPEKGPTTLLDGWSVEQAKASGASCAKLLLPYRPDRPLASAQEAVGRQVVAECKRVGIPIVLEPLFYDLDDPSQRPKLVLETAMRFAALQPDLLKLPFPVDPSDPDEDHWYGACRAISEIATMPWVLLSGGGSFDAYAKQVEVAVAAGGSGFMVGRALWGEAALAPADDRVALLADVVRPRMQRLRALID